MSEDDDLLQEAADHAWDRLSRRFDRDRVECPEWIVFKSRHEAGHAVAAWLHRQVPAGACILPHTSTDGREAGGTVLFLGSDGRSATLADIIVSAAGPAAARRFDPHADDGGSFDREDIERLLAAICRTGEAADIIRRHCLAEAERIVAENWDAVEAVAEALLRAKELTSADLAEVFDGVLIDRANAAKPVRAAAWARAEDHAASFAAIAQEMPR